ncbi:MAG: PhoH family protein [Candidatus Kapaibacteriota bacterium]|jgi:phosphate starvation-inducible PhoH-like protein
MINEKKFLIEDNDLLSYIAVNENVITFIENRFNSSINFRGNILKVKGKQEELDTIEKVFKEVSYMLKKNKLVTETDLKGIIDLLEINDNKVENFSLSNDKNLIYNGYKDHIRAKTESQLRYFNLVKKNDVVFAIGPAGTGKTFLAVAMALQALKKGEVDRLILSRPAVEAGESLGFLPGDLNEKIDPYLRPLTDALQSMISFEKFKVLREKNTIEINPLAYMRGRTLNNSFIILDEAQNSTKAQMKMFLTRLGNNSRAIITGDVTQIDLPDKYNSGLVEAENILQNIDGIGFIHFTNKDVVRHRLVAEIIKAYEHKDNLKNNKNNITETIIIEN